MRAACIAGLCLLLAGCQSLLNETYSSPVGPSDNPQTVGRLEKNDPRARLGAREHPRIVASYGGEYSDPQVERLLARIVGALTLASENPKQTYRITILNSPSVNAFALPGGYLYVTRGLLALANDSSEVAAVIAHEMAHVTANHGLQRQRAEEAEAIAGRVANEILSDEIDGRQVTARSKLRLAAFSRQQELQADVIGVRMLGEAGFDPYAAARFLQSMEAYSRFRAGDADASDQSLDFLSTHPDAPKRLELANRHARAFGPPGTGTRDRDMYLKGINGLLYGDSPNEGYVRGLTFLHPNLGIRFSVPEGFQIDNTAQAVLATGPGDVAIRFDGVTDRRRTALTNYITSGWVSGLIPSTVRSAKINGLDAATARASADKWDFDVTVIRVKNRIYRLLTAAPKGSRSLETTARLVRDSFRKLSLAEVAALKPLRIRTETVKAGDTVTSLAGKMRGTNRRLELFRLLNALPRGSSLSVGQDVKIVTDR
ncbi:M48 family metalloprotease [Hoeflea prorocentri]|uniref:M48 family metalloprotease n=1 Tax=Hoeflea prorocentri TaxID=1922333 RepID=A0A9X3UNC1_9HYPH|nr:M48 family metalloprotease [Hoeflea prorocentri]MCY6383555.1 M48 family metalloprotease [Hoeflea prorocentri]MDA5401355.1 M48 family metalloprotease [Hoeflea prorocentri]